MYTFARIEGSNPSLTAKLQRTALQSSNERLDSKGIEPFLLSVAMTFHLLRSGIYGKNPCEPIRIKRCFNLLLICSLKNIYVTSLANLAFPLNMVALSAKIIHSLSLPPNSFSKSKNNWSYISDYKIHISNLV